jgi:hypothetical protein
LCERGLYVELGAYKCHVFLDFREISDNEWHHYEHLAAYLNGRGVPSVEAVRLEILFQPVHHPFMELVNADVFKRLMKGRVTKAGAHAEDALLDEVEGKMQTLLQGIKGFAGGQGDEAAIASEVRAQLSAALRLPVLKKGEIGEYLRTNLNDHPPAWGVLFGWLFVHGLGKTVAEIGFEEHSRSWLDEWQLGRMLAGVLRDLGLDEEGAEYAVTVIKLLTARQRWFEEKATVDMFEVLSSLFRDNDAQRALQVNRYQDTLWFNKEAFEQIIWWMFVIATVVCTSRSPHRPAVEIPTLWETVNRLRQASEASGYQVEKLLGAVMGSQEEVPT